MAQCAMIQVANEAFAKGNAGLAIDIARAMQECRLPWPTEQALRSMGRSEAEATFEAAYAALGNGAAFSRVAEWLKSNVKTLDM